MKKYNVCFPEYGQCMAGKVVYWQKMGLAEGIVHTIKMDMLDKKLYLSDWTESIDVGNGTMVDFTKVTVVIPTSDNFEDFIKGYYPCFSCNGKSGVIDMLHFGGELQFHIMFIDYKEEKFVNGYWHTVRENLNLQDTSVLFEYVTDRLKDLIILPMAENGKYNATGALGVGIKESAEVKE